MNTNENTNATIETPVVAVVAETPVVAAEPAGDMLSLDMVKAFIAAGRATPDVAAYVAAVENASKSGTAKAVDRGQFYDSSFSRDDGSIICGFSVRPAGVESVRPKCWLSDAEMLVVLNNVDAIRAMLNLPADDRTSTKPRNVESKPKTGAKSAKTPAGKKAAKADERKAAPKASAIPKGAVSKMTAAGLKGKALKEAVDLVAAGFSVDDAIATVNG